MKGYIQGIESENLGEKETNSKTHLWCGSVENFRIDINVCEFIYRWDVSAYSIRTTSCDGYNYTGSIQENGFEPTKINFSYYFNNNRKLLIGNYLDRGTEYLFYCEVS